MPLNVGGGLAGAGLDQENEATQQLGDAAQVETNRNIENQRIVQQNRSSNMQMGTTGGMAAGWAVGAANAAAWGSNAGPYGAMIGGVLGGLMGGLQH